MTVQRKRIKKGIERVGREGGAHGLESPLITFPRRVLEATEICWGLKELKDIKKEGGIGDPKECNEKRGVVHPGLIRI